MKEQPLQTVVETPEFIKQAYRCMDKKLWDGFIDYIAKNPLMGDVMVGTGGARKIRWSGHVNQGKSGGARIIYYYHDRSLPIFLFTAYGKNQRANLSQAESNALKSIIKQIIQAYGRENDE